MKRIVLLAFVMSLFLSACLEKSDNPLDSPPEAAVDPTPFLGDWVCLRAYAGTNNPGQARARIQIAQDTNGILKYTAIFTTETNQPRVFMLTAVNGQVVASITNDVIGGWYLMGVSMGPGATSITLRLPATGVLRDSITNNVIAGSVEAMDSRVFDEYLTASGSQIRSYLTTHTNVFCHTNEFMFLQKVP